MTDTTLNEKDSRVGIHKVQIGILLLAVVVVAAGLFYFFQQKKGGLAYEDNATIGVMPGVDMEQRRKEMQQQLDDSMMAFSVNTSPVFVSGAEAGNLMIENPEQNAKLLIVEIYRNDTNELLYKSKALRPGTYMEQVKLSKVLEKGVYDATVYFKAYKEDTEEYIGQTGAAVTITVQS